MSSKAVVFALSVLSVPFHVALSACFKAIKGLLKTSPFPPIHYNATLCSASLSQTSLSKLQHPSAAVEDYVAKVQFLMEVSVHLWSSLSCPQLPRSPDLFYNSTLNCLTSFLCVHPTIVWERECKQLKNDNEKCKQL